MDAAQLAQVFSFSGRVGDSGMLQRGFAYAHTHHQVIECFSRWGFRIEAITARDELLQTIQVMREIATQAEGIGESDFICLWPSALPQYEPDQVFMVQGHSVNSQAALGGFAVAPTADLMVSKLFGLGFEVRTHASLGELEASLREIDALSVGDPEIVDLLELSDA
ncbi:hypothetical protein ACW0US_17910 [Xanthomonas euvesicatoria]